MRKHNTKHLLIPEFPMLQEIIASEKFNSSEMNHDAFDQMKQKNYNMYNTDAVYKTC